ncbi:hypothetical protein NQ176_g10562 [Zarea fungicola]|uniref:Uncharacterized protein n=1 Tax=Zarea fungicola TaxID=93591 RepID=A0ACC1MFD8_9HYPO|nr:hypothetical protein NQ176_g10562 [Lecanicillium fungicola]
MLGLSVIPLVWMRTRLPPSGRVRSLMDKSALKDITYLAYVAGGMTVFLVLYTAYFYIQVYTEINHLSSLDFAPYTVTLLNVGSVAGRILPMYVSDKIGVMNVSIACCFASAVLGFGWMGLHNLGSVVIWAILYGVTSGAVVVGVPVAIMALSPDMARMGTRLGMAFGVSGITILVGTPIAGAIFGKFTHERWLAGIGYSAGGLILGTCFMLVSWFNVSKKKGTWKI